jgi:UDP-N-acetylmuramyl pentapeptide phosphotransferase/UDP-N-acetylglucosamine-1-phosphate transferase
MVMILTALAIMTFSQKWYLATTILIVIATSLVAFLRYNINPAKIFM